MFIHAHRIIECKRSRKTEAIKTIRVEELTFEPAWLFPRQAHAVAEVWTFHLFSSQFFFPPFSPFFVVVLVLFAPVEPENKSSVQWVVARENI